MDLKKVIIIERGKNWGLAQISFAEAYEELKPDILVVLGDRYEIFSTVSAADNLVVWDKEYMSNRYNTIKYNDIKEQWKEVYENQLKLVDNGLTQSMWKAPGV